MQGTLGPLDIGIVIAYLAAIVGMSYVFARRQQTGEDYFLAGRRMGGLTLATSILANQASAVSLVGAPAFAAVLTWVGSTQSGVWGFIYLFVFSLGMTALLIAIGLFSGTLASLPRDGRWTGWVKNAAGVLMLAMAEYYFVKMGQVV